jgi:hypothetical protein
VGETEMKANFSHVYSKYESAVLQPYTQFLENVFRKFRNPSAEEPAVLTDA